MITLLFSYWIFPSNQFYLAEDFGHSNFIVDRSPEKDMQFHDFMRYPNKNISFRIENCSIAKNDEMLRSFEWIENKTVLSFYEVEENEEISVTCEDIIVEGERGAFIAGEGGVTNVVVTKNFNVILNGKVLLLRESQCPDPIVGTHELLHALGFDHSDNPQNIMYPTVRCGQTIGDDLEKHIDYLYSFESLPDLSLGNVSAKMVGRNLDLNVSVRNDGLKLSRDATIITFADGKKVNEFELGPIELGTGKIVTLQNIRILQPKIEEIKILIEHDYPELNKKNNRVRLVLKEED